jgi:serine protease Do
MMDDDKKRHDYSDFFQPDSKKSLKNGEASSEQHYYSYGPFKPSLPEQSGAEDKTIALSYTEEKGKANTGGWHYPVKKRSSFKSYFSAFLAGALVVGSLMFGADKMNLFTDTASASPYLGANQTNVSDQGAGNGQGEVRTASLDIVRPNTIADIVEQSSPAVVKIDTFVTGSRRSTSPFNDQFFRDFFGEDIFSTPNQNGNGQRQQAGMGSGFIFDKSGYILTNEHVVSGADEIYVNILGHKEPYKAELLGSDFNLDLAVLKISGNEPFPVLPFGDSSKSRVGDWLIAIGNPIGFEHTVSVGVLSAKERQIDIPDQRNVRQYEHLLQTDASINPGNSGGPLLNLNGEVIGMNTAVSTNAQGIGFAIPTSTIIDVLDQLKNNEKIPKPYIGVYLANIDETWLKDLKLQSTDGALVTQVMTQSPASRAGLQVYDVITELNGKAVKNTNDLIDAVKSSKIGERVSMTIIRDGKTINTAVIIGDANKE